MTTASPSAADAPALQVGILLFPGVEPLDAIGPAQVFWSLESGRRFSPPFRAVDLHLVAETDEPVAAGHGLVVHPTVSYADCPDLDVLIVPGGTGRDTEPGTPPSGRLYQSGHEPTLAFVRRQAEGAEVVASVCTGTFVLAGAGLIDGRRVNTHWSARDELAAFVAERGEKVELVAERVVDDGDLVTAGGVSSGIDLALHLLERLLGPDQRDLAAIIMELETPAA